MQRKRIQNIIGFSLASWISAGLNFVVIPISTRLFEPSELAKINLFYSVATILMTIGCMGIDQGYMRFYNEFEKQKRDGLLTWCIRTSIVLICLLTVLGIPIREKISIWLYGENERWVLSSLFICTICMIIYRYISILYRMECSVIAYTIIAVVSSALVKLSYLLAPFIRAEHTNAISIMTIVSLISILLICCVHRKLFRTKVSLNSVLNKDFFRFSIPLFPLGFMVQLNNYLPQFIIRNGNDFSKLGVFSSAVTLSGGVNLIQSGINIFWTPYVLKNYKDKDNDIKSMQNYLFIILLVFATGVMLFSDMIVFILGEKYRSALEYLPFLLLIPISYTLAEITGSGIIISKKSYWNIIIYSITIVINFVLAKIMYSLFGVLGVAISSGLSAIFMLNFKTIIAQKEFETLESKKKYLFYMTILLLVAIFNTIFMEEKIIKIVLNIVSIFLIMGVNYRVIRKEIGKFKKNEKNKTINR